MPEVVRGSRSSVDILRTPSRPQILTPSSSTQDPNSLSPTSPSSQRHVAFQPVGSEPTSPSPRRRSESDHDRRRSSAYRRDRRDSLQDAEAQAYYDSRAATKKEYRRRASTLQEYYKDNPDLLPQLPFTWHHGVKRFRLAFFIVLLLIDACVVPIVLYYGLTFGGNVASYITFAIVTSVWGGPTYLEFGVRTFRLMKKERFYRPLGTDSRWCFDLVTYASILTIGAVTALFIIGSAPHEAWIRVLSMPAPALLYALGGILALLTLYNVRGWKAPFRISSTAKGEPVKPGVYYFIEDVAAVNAVAGRPYREALAARYEASPRFRQMLYNQSIFWSVPPLILAVPLTVIACLHAVPRPVAYGVCWAVPFIWVTIWGLISVSWVKRAMRREREEWEAGPGIVVSDVKNPELHA